MTVYIPIKYIFLYCRCNDVLELVQTTRHFRLLADAAEVGGAGTQSLDALVKEIQTKYDNSMSDFFSVVDNVLAIDGSQAFEKAFFTFRTIVKVSGNFRLPISVFFYCTIKLKFSLLEEKNWDLGCIDDLKYTQIFFD